MRIASLDLGDRWTGCALSDPLKIIARPYKTIETQNIHDLIQELIQQQQVNTIIIGYPRTMRGTESEQTKKVVMQKEKLQKEFSELTFILWDERLTSQRAARLRQPFTKQEKLQSHALAAAFILEAFLQSLSAS